MFVCLLKLSSGVWRPWEASSVRDAAEYLPGDFLVPGSLVIKLANSESYLSLLGAAGHLIKKDAAPLAPFASYFTTRSRLSGELEAPLPERRHSSPAHCQ
ncbi:uncharacterized protein LOC135089215 isoform X2 [Scylla paramamosain]|uniref:uncharacterized protein LOC135089215 isoform X2 n=1 Tax=Scylla paramamosain TaxID=85552 RepID=UPI003083BFB6